MYSYNRDAKGSKRSGEDTMHQKSSEVGRVQEAGAAREDFVDRVPHKQDLRGDRIWTGLEKGASML